VARHIGRQLPGNPAVVAQNMPGASSRVLANFLFNQAPRDGTSARNHQPVDADRAVSA
jgi:hypothetical protein